MTHSLVHSNTCHHGVFLSIFERGVLLTGESGCGKSDCALALLSRGHQLIADDAPTFSIEGGVLMGSCSPTIRNLLEVRGFGIIDVTQQFGENAVVAKKRLELVLCLQDCSSTKVPFPKIEPEIVSTAILGVNVPTVSIDISLTRHVAILLETAVSYTLSVLSTRESHHAIDYN